MDVLVESFVSPLRADRVVVAIVPGGSDAIDAVRALFTPSERQGPVYGGVAVSRNGRFESFLVGTLAYHAGNSTAINTRQLFCSNTTGLFRCLSYCWHC